MIKITTQKYSVFLLVKILQRTETLILELKTSHAHLETVRSGNKPGVC